MRIQTLFLSFAHTFVKKRIGWLPAVLLLMSASRPVCAQIPVLLQVPGDQAVQQGGKNINLVCRQKELGWVINRIEKQSGLSFVFSNDEVNIKRKVSITIKDQPVKKALHEIFTPLDIRFELFNNKILLRKAPPGSNANSGEAAPVVQRPPPPVTVRGTVVDENRQPLQGVSVSLKGGSAGTSTDADGQFALEIPALEGTLIISYVGYQSREVAITGDRLLIQLQPLEKSLEEVVVVGYGTRRKISVTGGVDVIKPAAIGGRASVNLSQALQGTAPSLVIQQTNPEPGAPLSMNIRGISTIGNNSPLVVIDGIAGGDINLLNPSDIESISILKDAGAAAIYGSRSANGVILITTKKGKKNMKPLVTYNGIVSVQVPHVLFKPVKGYENAILRDEAIVNAGQSPIYSPEDIRRLKEQGDEEWMVDGILQNALQQNHNISVSGGTAQSTYLISAGYLDQASNFVGPDYGLKRYNFRMNLTNEFGRVKLTTLLSYAKTKIKDHSFSTQFLMADAERTPTYYKLKDSLGRYLTNDVLTEFNPLGILEQGGSRQYNNDNLFGSINAELKITKDLTLKGVVGGTVQANHLFARVKEVDYFPKGTYGADRNTSDENSKSLFINTQLLAEYKTKIQQHSIDVMGGFANESYTSESNALYLKYTDPDLGTPTTGTIIDPASRNTNQGTNETSLNSFIGRAGYSYADKYFAEVNFRADASSKFSKNNRWGYFPSVSAAWRISEEKFFEPVRNRINELKLRASYGVLGNQNTGAYQYQTTYFSFVNAYGFNNTAVAGTGFTFANPDITWEKAATFNAGIDVSVLNRALTFSFDYFNKLTRDILLNPPTPGTYGASVPDFNLGKMRNEGWEFTATYQHRGEVFRHSLSANIADSRNEVTFLDGKQFISGADEMQVILKEGLPYNSYIGLKRDGYFQNLDDIIKGPKPDGVDVGPGDIRFKDKNGDGVIDDQDRYVLGNPFPRYTFGLHYTLEWKNLDLSVFIQGVGKRSAFIRGELVEPFHFNYSQVMYVHQLDYWRPDNMDARYPRLAANGSASNTNNFRRGSDLYLFNAAYARLKNLQIGYTLPASLARRLGIQQCRAYLTGQNLLTLSAISFIDPESSEFRNGENNLSVTNGANSGRAYPMPIYYGMGIDVTF